MCTRQGSNLGPGVYKTPALPTELRVRSEERRMYSHILLLRTNTRIEYEKIRAHMFIKSYTLPCSKLTTNMLKRHKDILRHITVTVY